MTLLTVSLAALFRRRGLLDLWRRRIARFGFRQLFQLPNYAFSLSALIDQLALTMVIVTNVITLLVGRSSYLRYLHRDPGVLVLLLLLLFSRTQISCSPEVSTCCW